MTLNVTGTVAGEPDAPFADIVMFPEYAPAERPATFAVTCTTCEGAAVPLPGAALSQGWSVVSAKLRGPPPVFETVRFAGAGLIPFWTAVKTRLDGETDRTGCVDGAAEA